MNALGVALRTYGRLGVASLARVGLYRLGLATGLHAVHAIKPPRVRPGRYFEAVLRSPVAARAADAWWDRPWAFGRPVGPPSSEPPDWHANIFSGARVRGAEERWDRLAAVSAETGDIKAVG